MVTCLQRTMHKHKKRHVQPNVTAQWERPVQSCVQSPRDTRGYQSYHFEGLPSPWQRFYDTGFTWLDPSKAAPSTTAPSTASAMASGEDLHWTLCSDISMRRCKRILMRTFLPLSFECLTVCDESYGLGKDSDIEHLDDESSIEELHVVKRSTYLEATGNPGAQR